jgi:hypothetical protein
MWWSCGGELRPALGRHTLAPTGTDLKRESEGNMNSPLGAVAPPRVPSPRHNRPDSDAGRPRSRCHSGAPHPRPQRRRRSASLRPGLERRVLGDLQGRHAHQGRRRRQHRPRRHLHEGRLRPRARGETAHGSSSRSTSSTKLNRSATTAGSAPGSRASTTARYCSCSTCSRRCARPQEGGRAANS